MSDSDDHMTVDALLASLAEVSKVPQPAAIVPVKMQPGAGDDELPVQDLPAMLNELAEAQADRLAWPADWFHRRDVGDVRACRALWGASLHECIRSALGAAPGETQGHLKAGQVPFSWIGSKEFHHMAALAGLDGQALSDRIHRQAADPAMLARFSAGRQDKRDADNG